MTLTDHLNRLSEIAPKVCQIDNGVFSIGDYHFWTSEYYGFCAGEKIKPYNHITGRPALAWLRDALEQAIETRGWWWDISRWPPSGYKSEVATYKGQAKTSTEALLAAFVAALEGER